MDFYALWLGYAVMASAGTALALLVVMGLARLINRASWAVLDCYGGIQTFKEFRRWYRTDRLAPDARTCAESQTDHG